MAQENGIYVIAGGNQQIWAVDPKTRQRLRIKLAKDRSKVFDVYASGSGVYHVSELITSEQKKVDGYTKTFDVNYVQVVDSISGKPCVTITPPGVDGVPLEQRLVSIEFQFLKKGDSLLYTLNDSEGVVFPHCNAEIEQSGMTNFDGKDLYFGDKRIASLDEEILYAKEVDAKRFARAFRVKNKPRYNKNKAFFG